MKRFLRSLGLGALLVASASRTALAAEPAAPASAAPVPAPEPAKTPDPAKTAEPANAAEPVQPVQDPARNVTLEPKAAEPKPPGRATFSIDPIADSGLIVVSLGFATVLELINSTGEIRPQQIAPNFDRNQLIGIDRASITATPSKSAGSLSNAGLGLAVAFSFIDPVLSGFREHSVQTGLVDGMLYAESLSLTFAFTDMIKLAVRRPRPGAYIAAENDANFTNTSTDSALSFFSGHASMTAAVGATATYLAFTRSPHSARPWITLAAATVLTSFVSIERVRAGKHFPTDVLAGAVAGAGIGIIVPHLHRSEDVEQRKVWVGFTPLNDRSRTEGGLLHLTGIF
jgi:undecaprenyl-diphosphatase